MVDGLAPHGEAGRLVRHQTLTLSCANCEQRSESPQIGAYMKLSNLNRTDWFFHSCKTCTRDIL